MDDLDYRPFREPLSDDAIDQILRKARTHNAWLDRPVSDETLRELVALASKGPTSANQSPARFVFVKSPEAKARLEPHLSSVSGHAPATLRCVTGRAVEVLRNRRVLLGAALRLGKPEREQDLGGAGEVE